MIHQCEVATGRRVQRCVYPPSGVRQRSDRNAARLSSRNAAATPTLRSDHPCPPHSTKRAYRPRQLTRDHLTITTSGFPFSTTYVASSAPVPPPTFFAAWIVLAGMNRTSPALSVG